MALVAPDRLAGTFHGNGCIFTPRCLRVEISPACGGGICVYKYAGDFFIPIQCQYMMNCGGKCYTDCDDEGWFTPDENHINAKCGQGFVREGTGAYNNPPGAVEMQRAAVIPVAMPVAQGTKVVANY